jgi:5-methylcytosine-specific restriction protein A
MPYKPPRPCRYRGCPALTNDRSGYCPAHLKVTRRSSDALRGSSTARGYDYRWQKESKLYLIDHPLCVLCLPRPVPAVLVDHIIPHKGDPVLFWDKNNWQPLCMYHHNKKTAEENRKG